MPQLKAIFYDMDGTLVHFQINYRLARKRAIEELENQGIYNANQMFSVTTPWTTTLREAQKYMENQKFSEKRIRSIMEILNDKIVQIERKAALEAKKVDSMERMLEFGQLHNLKQIIVTFNTHETAVITLKVVDWLHYFDDIYGRDDVNNPKPHKDHLQIAAEKYGFTPESSILIGDMSSDIQAAKNFGCPSIGIRTDFEINTIENADYIVNQNNAANEIIKILKTNYQWDY